MPSVGGHGTIDPSTTLSVASATGPGLTVDLKAVYSNPVMQVATNGAVASGVVALEGSLDGETWYTVGTSGALTTADVVVTPASGVTTPARYLRGNITTIVVGGTITCKVGAGA